MKLVPAGPHGLEKYKTPLYSLPNDDPGNHMKSPKITNNH